MPVVLWIGVIALYFIFVVFVVIGKMQIQPKSTLLLLIFHISLLMFAISYYITAKSDPGQVPHYYNYTQGSPE